VNEEGEWKVVFAVKYKMIIRQIINGNYLVCGGCETGSGPDETRESDVGQHILPSSSSNNEVKFFDYNFCLEANMNM